MGSTQEEAAGHGSRPSGEKDFPGTPFLSGGIALGAEMGRGLESSPQCPPLLGTKPRPRLGTAVNGQVPARRNFRLEWRWEMGQLETDKELICQRISHAHKCSETHIKPGRITEGTGWLDTSEEVLEEVLKEVLQPRDQGGTEPRE